MWKYFRCSSFSTLTDFSFGRIFVIRKHRSVSVNFCMFYVCHDMDATTRPPPTHSHINPHTLCAFQVEGNHSDLDMTDGGKFRIIYRFHLEHKLLPWSWWREESPERTCPVRGSRGPSPVAVTLWYDTHHFLLSEACDWLAEGFFQRPTVSSFPVLWCWVIASLKVCRDTAELKPQAVML